jgi:hypothetical protein
MKPVSRHASKPLLFLSCIVAIFIAFSVIAPRMPSAAMRKINFLSDISGSKKKNKPPRRNERLLIAASGKTTGTGDQAMPVRDFETYPGLISYEKNHFVLTRFIQALADLKAGKRKKIRVAYFGDSIVEGDLISMNFRKQLQDSFGGTGVGFIPVTSIVAQYRVTINHSFSKNWEDYSFKNHGRDSELFLSGHSFRAGSVSDVTYKAPDFPHLDNFPEVHLIYGPTAAPFTVKVNDQLTTILPGGICSKELIARDCKKVHVTCSDPVPLYGLSFEAQDGVYVDNYSFRGITGIELSRLQTQMLSRIQQLHDYDLVIFQYGPNLLEPKVDEYSWYEKPMNRIMAKFKTAFPNASLLVISTGDKAYRYDDEWQTGIGVEPLMESQNNIAATNEINFWNLYRAMGGHNSIIEWTTAKTALAKQDYTHFTYQGAKKVAEMLFTEIMKEYGSHK